MTDDFRHVSEFDTELARIETEYQHRALNQRYNNLYSYFHEGALLQYQSLEHYLLAMLKRHAFSDLAEKRILDLGCGNGQLLQRFISYGARPEHLYGVDLLTERIEQAHYLFPGINWRVGSGHALPYPDKTFDLVTSFVVFSSILDLPMHFSIANEIWRVLKPGGLILLYDFIYPNPNNPAVRGVPLRHIRQIFQRSGAAFDCKRITLAPPIARKVTPLSYWLALTIEQLFIFNTHCLCIIYDQ